MRLHTWMLMLGMAAGCGSLTPYISPIDVVKPGDNVTDTDITSPTESDEPDDTDVVWETGDTNDTQPQDDSDDPGDTQPPGAVCGNSIIETGEVCDGAQLGGQTCVTQGFSGGTLVCGVGCTAFNTSACTTAPAFRDPICEDTCPGGSANWLGDGYCDDGLSGSSFSVCPPGSDCTDCGPRTNTSPGCNDVCPQANNGQCNDGGAGSVSNYCILGDDCSDCGPR